MAKQSAGILLYRLSDTGPAVLLVHPGGPFWAKKDAGAWSIPKGEFEAGEDTQDAARREILEETGVQITAALEDLGVVKQKSGKLVHAWAARQEWDPARLRSNTFQMEYPPRSGRTAEFPEVDRAAWFDLSTAREKINQAQVPFLDRLSRLLHPGAAA